MTLLWQMRLYEKLYVAKYRTLDTQLPSALMWTTQLVAFNKDALVVVIFNNTWMSAHCHEEREGPHADSSKVFSAISFKMIVNISTAVPMFDFSSTDYSAPLKTLLNINLRIICFLIWGEAMDINSESEKQLKILNVCLTYKSRKKLNLPFLGKMAQDGSLIFPS